MFAALLCATAATAEVIDGISYRLSKNQTGNTAAVKQDYNVSYSGELIIPPTVTYEGETYTVTGIDSRALQDISMVTKLSLPATVTYIASNNFIWKNSLESITVAEGNPTYDSRGGCNAIIETRENKLVAGCTNTVIPEGIIYFADGALGGTGLATIVIPKSVVSIGEGVFSGCEKLTAVTILGSLAEGIDEGAFSGCNALTDIYLYAETPPSLNSEAFGEDGIIQFALNTGYSGSNGLGGWTGKGEVRKQRMTYDDNGDVHYQFSIVSGTVNADVFITLFNNSKRAVATITGGPTITIYGEILPYRDKKHR